MKLKIVDNAIDLARFLPRCNSDLVYFFCEGDANCGNMGISVPITPRAPRDRKTFTSPAESDGKT